MDVRMLPLRAASLAGLVSIATIAASCDGGVGGGPAGPRRDGSAGDLDSGTATPCGPTGAVLTLFAERCARCHGEGGSPPELTAAGLPALLTAESAMHPGERFVVPGDPDASWLYRKVAGTQGAGGGALMPLGASDPIREITVVEAWIRAGAPTECDAPPPDGRRDPNTLPQDELFTCTGAASPSPARIRRIERTEWTHSAGKTTTSTAHDNPFGAPPELPYSSYAEDVTIDAATFDLYLQVLPQGGSNWAQRDGRGRNGAVRTYIPYNDRSLACMFGDATAVEARPSDACIDGYLMTLLERGVLFRAPTDAEFARLRDFTVAALAAETDVAQRGETLTQVTSAAWLMSGALFRSDLGAVDPEGRRRLTDDELALALGAMIDTHPPGASAVTAFGNMHPDHPGWTAPPEGYLAEIRAAADEDADGGEDSPFDGRIQDPAERRRLLERYRGGVDPMRFDLAPDLDARARENRGEYWLAPRIAGFFREWLDVGPALTIFKDRPRATTRWDALYTGDPMWDPISGAYGQLQSPAISSGQTEGTLVDHLDDTIARAVIESARDGRDLFRELLTTRTWRVPSNVRLLTTTTCASAADCIDPDLACDLARDPRPDYGRCVATSTGAETGRTCRSATECNPYPVCRSPQMRCGTSTSTHSVWLTTVYGVDDPVDPTDPEIPDTPDGRWVTVPPAERAGVLTHPAWLSAHGGNFEDDASIVHRGRWIRENLFCETVPGLELVMVEARLIAPAPELSARERVRQSIETGPESATCMGCHRLMNSLGYPFEAFNHAGFVRAEDHGGAPDGSTTVASQPEQRSASIDGAYASVIDFVEAIAGSREAKRCFIRQAFRYFAGRDETLGDACTLAAMEQALDETGSFFEMLAVLVESDTFVMRSAEGGAP